MKSPNQTIQPTRLRRAALNKRKESIVNDETNPLALGPPEAGG